MDQLNQLIINSVDEAVQLTIELEGNIHVLFSFKLERGEQYQCKMTIPRARLLVQHLSDKRDAKDRVENVDASGLYDLIFAGPDPEEPKAKVRLIQVILKEKGTSKKVEFGSYEEKSLLQIKNLLQRVPKAA